MEKKRDQLSSFLSQTQAIYTHAQSLDSDMDKNDEGQLERLQDLFDQRQETIEALADDFAGEWAGEEQAIIAEIQQTEIQLQPLMTRLHEQFSLQMNRLNQTRQASGKYAGAYRQSNAGGSFIDQRK